MDLPLVSVITPVLNRIDTIQRCLSSVEKQTYQKIEHIVVDGGSTDGTIDHLRGHVSSRDFRWISEPDGGMYDAINKGLSMAQGEILAYLNSDDLYLPWSVDVAVDRLDRADLIYGDLGILLVEEDAPAGFYVQFYRDFDVNHYAYIAALGQPTVFWWRRLSDEIGEFDDSYRLIGDCEYWLRAAGSGALLVHVSEVLAVQVEHEGTLRATQERRLQEEFVRLRAAMRPTAGQPPHLKFERIKKGLEWRWRNLDLMLSLKSGRESKWPHFVRFLRENGIRPTTGDALSSLLPARWRRHPVRAGDLGRVYAAILDGMEDR